LNAWVEYPNTEWGLNKCAGVLGAFEANSNQNFKPSRPNVFPQILVVALRFNFK